MNKIIGCDCGHVIQGETDHELATNAQGHARDEHNTEITIEQALALAVRAESMRAAPDANATFDEARAEAFVGTVLSRLVSGGQATTVEFLIDGYSMLRWRCDLQSSVAAPWVRRWHSDSPGAD